jgi:hypothetical protein
MIEILIGKIWRPFLATFFSASVLDASAVTEKRTLVDESRMIRTQMWSVVDKKMVAVAWDALCDTTP